jgi:hypothetical protein
LDTYLKGDAKWWADSNPLARHLLSEDYTPHATQAYVEQFKQLLTNRFSSGGYNELPDARTSLNRLKQEADESLFAYYRSGLDILARIGRKDKKESRLLELPQQTLLEIAVNCWVWGLQDKELYVNMTKHLCRNPSFKKAYRLAEGKRHTFWPGNKPSRNSRRPRNWNSCVN